MLSKISLRNKVLALLFIISSLVLTLYFNAVFEWLTAYSTGHILEETEIMNPRRIIIIKIGLILIIVLALISAVSLLMNLPEKVYNLIKRFTDFQKLNTLFLTDQYTGLSAFTKIAFSTSLILAIFIQLRQLIFGDHVKEDIFEHISEVLFVIDSLLFFVLLFYVKYLNISRKDKKVIRGILVLSGFILLFIFLEEISYGQHIFGWQSSEVFATYNFQGETNIHNFINPFYRFLYPLAGFGIFFIYVMLWFFYKGDKPAWLAFFTPHKSMIVLVFLMAASTYRGHSEAFENLLSIFLCIYALRLLIYLKKQKAKRI